MNATIAGEDGLRRCRWCVAAPDLLAYHDSEWGFPVSDDRRLFERLCLESFQSGLSWRTILAKRDQFRIAFHQFDFEQIARFGPRDIACLLANEGIVRHRGKIEATINNARQAQALAQREGSLAAYFWKYEPSESALASKTSTELARDLKRRGWTFIGSTTAYAFMQAAGLVNDHDPACTIWERAEQARARFNRP